jgi:subtilisin family serine protease
MTVGLLLATVTAGTASAQPSPTAGPPVGATGVTKIMLVTGDVVTVWRTSGGYSATAEPGPDRAGDPVPVTFQTLRTPEGDLYVFPSDVSIGSSAGSVDPELFNVRRLIDDGYAAGDLPVIVQYRADTAPGARAATQADALPGTTKPRALESLNAAGVDVSAGDRDEFWQSVRGEATGKRGLRDGVERLWLDRKVTVTLDRSVAQIGAPAAWQAGLDGTGVTVAVLDTGIDATHPDLAGKIAGTRSFVPGESEVDGHGHGTHVASTIAGSGAASGGQRQGVAPGSQLLIGKVLDRGGNGQQSWIIDGMEWAATSGARVVSMSLGTSQGSDGTDPMSQTVNRLTEQTGALFVIAAANNGPAPGTIGAPGSAAAALTVGAVDRQDNLAGFSSRGPLVRSFALKPDLTAPGVGIVAARASGTSMPTPVDDNYTAASGTSMATPHVSGSAALLAQQHPDWRPGQLKAALTGSAQADPTQNAYAVGTGRVDVAKAITQALTANPSSVDFGSLSYPFTEPVSKTVTLTNGGGGAVTVDLVKQLADPSQQPADGRLSVTPASVTVPAGGTAEVTVSFSPGAGPPGAYPGLLRALEPGSGTELLRVAVGAHQTPPGHNLRLVATPPPGWTNTGRIRDWASWILLRVDAPQEPIFLGRDDHGVPEQTVWVPDGVYSVSTSFAHFEPVGGDFTLTSLTNPEVVVSGADRTVVLDGTKSVPVRLDTQRPNESTGVVTAMVRTTSYPGGGAYELGNGVDGTTAAGRASLRVGPTSPVTVGTVRFDTQIQADEKTVDLRLLGHNAPTLAASWAHSYFQEPKLDLDRRVTIVDAGSGTAQEIANADVRGKIALVTLRWQDAGVLINHPDSMQPAIMAALRDAGALAALVAMDEGPAQLCGPPSIDAGTVGCAASTPLPVLRIGPGEAAQVRAHAHGRPVSAQLTAKSRSSYNYQARFSEPAYGSGVYRLRPDQTRTLEVDYHSSQPRDNRPMVLTTSPGGASLYTRSWVPAPSTRTEYVGPVSDQVLWVYRATGELTADRQSLDSFDRITSDETMLVHATTQPVRLKFGLPTGLGAARFSPDVARHQPYIEVCMFCRDGQHLVVGPSQTSGDATHFGESYLLFAAFPWTEDRLQAHLYREGVEVPSPLRFAWDLSQFPEPAAYRLTYRINPTLNPQEARAIDTTWEFRSERPTGDESTPGFECLQQTTAPQPRLCRVERLLHVSFDLAETVRLDNTAVAGTESHARLHVYRQQNAPGSPVAGVQVEVSFDQGRTWERARVTPDSAGAYRVSFSNPRSVPAGTTVSLRAQAWDRDGNRVEQTLLDSYRLAAHR